MMLPICAVMLKWLIMINSVRKSNLLRLFVILPSLVCVLTTSFISLSCSNGRFTGTAESLTIGTMANAGDTLIFIADEEGYFAANGLDVTLKTYDSGLAATNMMLEGEADLAYATEFVVAGKALQKTGISIVATYSKNETVVIAGQKEHGIEHISDLKGKRIGLARGTINEFYLGRLLDLNGISTADVTLVDTKLTQLADALSNGSVDAVVAGSRNIYPIIQQQGSQVFTWPAHSGQPAYGTLVGKNDWITRHAEPVKRLMVSLAQAENYILRHPVEAKALVQKRLNYDDAYMASVWSEYQFFLSLDQSLITAMEDEARWLIGNNLTPEKQVPNFLYFTYEDSLKTVKPEAVSIIR
jgi:NitT/TauT family transport system substrate-binding protein